MNTSDDDSLPYSYQNPETEGKLIWICDKDADGKITSVFVMNDQGGQEKKCSYLKDLDEAKNVRNTLIDNGWRVFHPPKVVFTMPDGQEKTALSRKDKRFIAKQIEKERKKQMK